VSWANQFQVMGLAILRISNLQKKWRVKISQIMEERAAKGIAGKSRKYAMFVLPFITVLREGLEAVVFVGGVSLSEPASSFPLAVVVGIICGVLIGYFIYR
jgi:high-affinity iron transporter